MYELTKIAKVVTSKFVDIGPLFYEKKKKKTYRAAVSQRLRNTDIERCSLDAGMSGPSTAGSAASSVAMQKLLF